MPTPTISVQFDQASIARTKKILAKYQGRPLKERLERGTMRAAQMLVSAVRAYAPKGATGNLKASVKAWKSGARHTAASGKAFGSGFVAAAGVGPTGRQGAHRHLVIRGHRIVTTGGRDTGRRSIANPFVDAAVQPRLGEALRIVSAELFRP